MTYVSRQLVRFAHVDAAGIVFYPRYFEMVNAAVEDYFADVIGVSFAAMHVDRRVGVPTVRLDATFSAVSRLGDELDFLVMVRRVGASSSTLEIDVRSGAERRCRVEVVLVCMDLASGRAIPWPDDLRPVRTEERKEHRVGGEHNALEGTVEAMWQAGQGAGSERP